MEMLEVLDLEGNHVDDLGALVYLIWCPELAVLTLAENPSAAEPSNQAQACLCRLTMPYVLLSQKTKRKYYMKIQK